MPPELSEAEIATDRIMRRAAIEALAGVAILSAMDAMVKGLAAHLPVIEVTFLRFAFGAVTAFAVVAVTRPGWPSRETLRVNGIRALLIVFTALCFFYALSVLPLAETLALAFLAPVFIALFGGLILRETINGRIVIALAAGFGGMLVIVYGKADAGTLGPQAMLGALAALASAVTYALAMVLLRARATRDSLVVIVTLHNLLPALILIVPAGFVWVAPTSLEWGWAALLGALGVFGHLLLAQAFKRAEAARLASLDYTSLIWAVVFGYIFFDETPTLYTFAGATLIILGALNASRR